MKTVTLKGIELTVKEMQHIYMVRYNVGFGGVIAGKRFKVLSGSVMIGYTVISCEEIAKAYEQYVRTEITREEHREDPIL